MERKRKIALAGVGGGSIFGLLWSEVFGYARSLVYDWIIRTLARRYAESDPTVVSAAHFLALWGPIIVVAVIVAGAVYLATRPERDRDKALALAERLPRFEMAPPPPAPRDEDGFDYPFPKAVMQARIDLETGTRDARAGEAAHRMSIVITVENKHKKTLRDCTVFVIGLIDPDGEEIMINKPLAAAERFELGTRAARRFGLITRDISDKVTPQPFLLRTAGPGIPLKENATYTLVIDLQCRYPHPTNLGVQIDTKTGLDARAVIVEQKLQE